MNADDLDGRIRSLVHDAVAAAPPAPDLPADLDDLTCASQRSVVLDAVEPLDHLRSGSAQSHHEATVGDEVQARRRHGGQRRGTGVDLKDSRSEFDGRRLGRQVTELADGVEGIRLRDEGDVEARLLQVTDLFDGFGEPAAVVQTHTDTHVVTPILTIAAVCDAHTSSGTPIEHLLTSNTTEPESAFM